MISRENIPQLPSRKQIASTPCTRDRRRVEPNPCILLVLDGLSGADDLTGKYPSRTTAFNVWLTRFHRLDRFLEAVRDLLAFLDESF